MPPKVSIIILNWNGLKDTLECLESLQKINYPNHEVIVVDNNSSGDDVNIIKEKFGDYVKEIIISKDNLGFSGGNNLGIKYSLKKGTDFILILNNDTIVEPDFLGLLINKFKLDEQAGIVAPLINYYNKPQIIWSAGGKINKIRGAGVAYSDKLSFINKKASLVEFVSGCCMLIKKEVFQKIEGFDENFFLYNEDTDLCLRVLRTGYKIFVESNSIIYHKVKSSTKRNLSAVALYYETRNRLYFVKKNFNNFYFITGLYIGITMIIKSVFWIISGEFKKVEAVWKSIRDFASGKMGK